MILPALYENYTIVEGPGIFVLGQEPDFLAGGYDLDQSFSWKITNVNVWSKVLSDSHIESLFECTSYIPSGDILSMVEPMEEKWRISDVRLQLVK